MESQGAKLIRLQTKPGGVAAGLETHLRPGRWEIASAGFDPNLQIVGGDPWGTANYTGLIVPKASTASITPVGRPPAQFRYLFMGARAQFHNGERVRLRGLRFYASLFGTSAAGLLVEREITSPLFRFPDANISYHVRILDRRWIDRRNPLNADTLMFRDAVAPALLFQTLGPYSPPNAGRPWGRPMYSDLGNIHDLRYPWRNDQAETALDIPVPAPCDIVVYISVAQHEAGPGPVLTATEFAAAPPEVQFWSAYSNVRYGRVAASLIFEEEYGSNPPDENDDPPHVPGGTGRSVG